MVKHILKEVADHLERTFDGVIKEERKIKSMSFFADGSTWRFELKLDD